MASLKEPGKNYYAILEVSPDSPARLIKEKYRSLVQRFHPDLFRTPEEAEAATQRMMEINEAFAVLSNKRNRAIYDAQNTEAAMVSPIPTPKAEWEDLKTPSSPQTAAANPAVDHAVADEFLKKLKDRVTRSRAAVKLREEVDKSWLWCFSGGTWNRSYWTSLVRLPVLSINTIRAIIPQLTLTIAKRRSSWKSSFFIFILAAESISEGETVLKLCRSFCNEKVNNTRGRLVNIVLVDLTRRRSIVCGNRPRDVDQQQFLATLST